MKILMVKIYQKIRIVLEKSYHQIQIIILTSLQILLKLFKRKKLNRNHLNLIKLLMKIIVNLVLSLGENPVKNQDLVKNQIIVNQNQVIIMDHCSLTLLCMIVSFQTQQSGMNNIQFLPRRVFFLSIQAAKIIFQKSCQINFGLDLVKTGLNFQE